MPKISVIIQFNNLDQYFDVAIESILINFSFSNQLLQSNIKSD